MMKRLLFPLFCLASLLLWKGYAEEPEESFAFQPVPVAPAAQEELFLLEKSCFTMGYSPRHRQLLWVGYFLTAENVNAERLKRPSRFACDPAVPGIPVRPEEYAQTGFDRGHMVPAADMSFALIPLNDSFLMSNITPQLPGCNRGVWKRLESKVRSYAQQEKEICVITGPVMGNSTASLKDSGITVPVAFYKVILDMTPPQKMIAFLVPNAPSKAPLICFAVTVDEVEALTGLDFFSSLEDDQENEWESRCDFLQWEPPSAASSLKPKRKK